MGDYIVAVLACVVLGLACLSLFERRSGRIEDATETLGVLVIICGVIVAIIAGRALVAFFRWMS